MKHIWKNWDIQFQENSCFCGFCVCATIKIAKWQCKVLFPLALLFPLNPNIWKLILVSTNNLCFCGHFVETEISWMNCISLLIKFVVTVKSTRYFLFVTIFSVNILRIFSNLLWWYYLIFHQGYSLLWWYSLVH